MGEAIKETGEDERSSPVVRRWGYFSNPRLVAKVPRFAEAPLELMCWLAGLPEVVPGYDPLLDRIGRGPFKRPA
jgi:hypothetical protein